VFNLKKDVDIEEMLFVEFIPDFDETWFGKQLLRPKYIEEGRHPVRGEKLPTKILPLPARGKGTKKWRDRFTKFYREYLQQDRQTIVINFTKRIDRNNEILLQLILFGIYKGWISKDNEELILPIFSQFLREDLRLKLPLRGGFNWESKEVNKFIWDFWMNDFDFRFPYSAGKPMEEGSMEMVYEPFRSYVSHTFSKKRKGLVGIAFDSLKKLIKEEKKDGIEKEDEEGESEEEKDLFDQHLEDMESWRGEGKPKRLKDVVDKENLDSFGTISGNNQEFSVLEVSELLDVPYSTLRYWIKKGEVETIDRKGQCVFSLTQTENLYGRIENYRDKRMEQKKESEKIQDLNNLVPIVKSKTLKIKIKRIIKVCRSKERFIGKMIAYLSNPKRGLKKENVRKAVEILNLLFQVYRRPSIRKRDYEA
jgi:DNA-binding transcriptional MerR regulator